MNSRTIRALDIGYGLIKFTRSHLRTDSSLDLGSFPTYAELAYSESRDPSQFTVNSEGVLFFMGSKSIDLSAGNARQFLEPSFFDSMHCVALALGAMANMKIPVSGIIDVLAIGLPMRVMVSKSTVKNLESKLLGDHVLPDLISGGDRKVTVKSTKFFVQQEAATSLTFQPAEGASPQKYNLYIDAGYVNLSWLTKNEQKAISDKTSSIVGGVTDLMEPMLARMKPDAFQNLRIRKRLDDAMRKQIPTIKVDGKELEIAIFLPILEAKVSENVSQILSNVGPIAKISKVYMSGGGAYLYHRKICEMFPKKTIFAPHSMSHFDAVRGLQMLAEMQN